MFKPFLKMNRETVTMMSGRHNYVKPPDGILINKREPQANDLKVYHGKILISQGDFCVHQCTVYTCVF